MAKNKKGTKAKSAQKQQRKNISKDNSAINGVCCIVAALLLILFFFVNSEAPINRLFKELLLGLFGAPAVLLPFILITFGIYIIKIKDMSKVARKAVLAFFILSSISAFLHLFEPDVIKLKNAFSAASCQNVGGSIGGGLFGACIALPLYNLFDKAAAYVILTVISVGLISCISECSVISLIFGICQGIYDIFSDSAKKLDTKKDYGRGVEMTERIAERKKSKANNMSASDILSEMKNAEVTKTKDSEEKITAGDDKIRSIKSKKKKLEEQTEAAKEDGFKNNIDAVFQNMYEKSEGEEDRHEPTEPVEKQTEKAEVPEKKGSKLTESEKEEINEEINRAKDITEQREYVFPSLELLNNVKTGNIDSRDDMYKTANKLISVLENFGVKAKLLQVTPGPSVTRYEILPNTGVKLSKIVGLADDLALNLAVTNVLVAPVPGKAAVGIEIPNKETASVTARELLESSEFKNSKSKLTVALGKDIGGRVIVGNIAKMPHLLIAGATGSGKSVCINTIITSLLYKASPEEVKLIMVDPKVVELGMYNGIPHLLIPVVTDPKKAAGALNWAVTEMMHRYDTFAENFVKNLEGYNNLMNKTGGEKLPQIVIIIDELADLMMVAAKEVEDYICRLAQLARAAGIHLIVATQRPTVDVITGLIKANIPSRIAFAVASQIDSRTIIDRGGADKLLGRGDMLYVPQGVRNPIRVQGAFVSDDEIERLIEFLKEGNEDSHYSEDLAEHIERISIGENGVTPDKEEDGDDLLPQAIELAVELGQISTAMIQRKLKVGYSRAGRIIDQMEERGVIGGANGSKPRQVYINHADLAAYTEETPQ